MKTIYLTPTERAWLARHHGIVVRREEKGHAKFWRRDGSEGWLPIDTLKDIIAGEGAA